jgi:hypothetical protein
MPHYHRDCRSHRHHLGKQGAPYTEVAKVDNRAAVRWETSVIVSSCHIPRKRDIAQGCGFGVGQPPAQIPGDIVSELDLLQRDRPGEVVKDSTAKIVGGILFDGAIPNDDGPAVLVGNPTPVTALIGGDNAGVNYDMPPIVDAATTPLCWCCFGSNCS